MAHTHKVAGRSYRYETDDLTMTVTYGAELSFHPQESDCPEHLVVDQIWIDPPSGVVLMDELHADITAEITEEIEGTGWAYFCA